MENELAIGMYGLEGLFHLIGHHIQYIREQIKNKGYKDAEDYLDNIIWAMTPKTIYGKIIPQYMVDSYIQQIKLMMSGQIKNPNTIEVMDRARQYLHITILRWTNEEKGSAWDKEFEKYIEMQIVEKKKIKSDKK